MNAWFTRNRGHVVVVLVNVIVTGLAVLWLRWPASGKIEFLVPSPIPPAPPTSVPPPSLIAVYVSGAVVRPDVYSLPEGSRVKDAIEAAGGFAAGAEREGLNLAAPLADGAQVRVPRAGEAALPSSPVLLPTTPARASVPGGRVNLNAASPAELDALPGIGPVLAQRIVDDRVANGPYRTLEDIKRVRGIGDALYEQIKELITVR